MAFKCHPLLVLWGLKFWFPRLTTQSPRGHIMVTVWHLWSQEHRELNPVLWDCLEGRGGGGRRREGTDVHPPRLSHGNARQRPAQHGKAIILQFKKKEEKKTTGVGKHLIPKKTKNLQSEIKKTITAHDLFQLFWRRILPGVWHAVIPPLSSATSSETTMCLNKTGLDNNASP